MSDTTREQLTRESIDAYSRADWPAVRALTGSGYVYDETGSGRHVEGPDEYVAALKSWKQAFPDSAGEITRVMVDGDISVAEVVWRGTHKGALETPGGAVPATNRTVEVWATLWNRWEGDQLVATRHHLDLLSLLAQVGALPG